MLYRFKKIITIFTFLCLCVLFLDEVVFLGVTEAISLFEAIDGVALDGGRYCAIRDVRYSTNILGMFSAYFMLWLIVPFPIVLKTDGWSSRLTSVV